MALVLSKHPILHTDEGISPSGADYYKASINGVTIDGTFKPLDGGVSVNINNEKIEQQVNGRVRVRIDQNRTANITFDCVYQVGTGTVKETDSPTPEEKMKLAMGIGVSLSSTTRRYFGWTLNPGDIWKFEVDTDASDRGNFDSGNESIPVFLNRELVLEAGSSMSVPAQGFWQLSLPFMVYLDSDVLKSDPISALTGEVIRNRPVRADQ